MRDYSLSGTQAEKRKSWAKLMKDVGCLARESLPFLVGESNKKSTNVWQKSDMVRHVPLEQHCSLEIGNE